MQIFISILLSVGTNTPYAQSNIDNLLNKPRTVKLFPFKTVKVYSGIVMNLIPSDENKMVVYGDPYQGVVAKEKGNTLKLKIRLTELIPCNQPFIDLYYTEQLNAIKIHQGAEVEALRPLISEKLVLKAHEGSEFSAEINASELTTKVHTNSIVNLYGKVKTHHLKVNTGGICMAEEMLSDRSWVTAFAGGNGRVYSEEAIHAKVHFGGNIYLFGNPEEIYAYRTFGGTIIDGNGFHHEIGKRRFSRLNRY